MLSWEKIEQVLNPAGLVLVLAFPVVAGIPLIGYLIETAAIFFVIFYAYRRKYLFLAISGVGSLILAVLLYFEQFLPGIQKGTSNASRTRG